MLLGLAANRLHHQNEDAALFSFLRACEQGIRELNIGFHAVGRTYDAIAAAEMLKGYKGMVRYPYGREGGLMKLVAEVVGMEGQTITTQDVFLFDYSAGLDADGRFLGHTVPTGIRPVFADKFKELGIPLAPSVFGGAEVWGRR